MRRSPFYRRPGAPGKFSGLRERTIWMIQTRGRPVTGSEIAEKFGATLPEFNRAARGLLRSTGKIAKIVVVEEWQTPIEIFNALDLEFGFWLDAAASESNALCAHYLTEMDDALSCEWKTMGAIFCNPPYSNIAPWITKAAEQCRKQCQPVVMLLPADISTGWFSAAQRTADELRLIIDGRIQFVPASITGKRQSNTKGRLIHLATVH